MWIPFVQDLSLENSEDSYLCFNWLYFTQYLTCFSSIDYLLHLGLCIVFYSISSNIDEVLSFNPSANVFVFEDFNVHHKDWLTSSGEADQPGELCYNFSISNDFTQMVNIPTRIPDCDSHRPALLDSFISSDASICFTMAFPPLGTSVHVVVSVSIDFPMIFQIPNRMPRFIAWLLTILVLIGMVFMIIWELFHGKVSLNIVLFLLVNVVSGFRLELMHISLTENIRSSLIHFHGFQLLMLSHSS